MTRVGIALALVLVIGCSSKPTQAPPKEAKETVEGTVVSGGQPVPFVMVLFHPENPLDAQRYEGAAGKDGTFTVQCPTGRYKVTVAPLHAGPGGAGGLAGGQVDAKGLKEIPRRYQDKSGTPLVEEIPVGGKKSVTLKIE
jgi:hypothetical protein